MNCSTRSCRCAPRLPHLTIAAHVTVRTSAGSQTFFLHGKTTSWSVLEKGGTPQISGITGYDWWCKPTTKLTCTWADRLHQCSTFHHSCICMQEALRQAPQWLQEQKPGVHRVNNETISHHSFTKPHRSSQAHVKKGLTDAKWDATQKPTLGSEGSRCTQAAAYLRHIHWSQTAPETTPVGRRRCIHQAGWGRGGYRRSYKGWVLKRRERKNTVRCCSERKRK